jgi:beta-N-acetylhexosaminidase
MRLIKSIIIFLVFLFISATIESQVSDSPFLKYINHPWVDSVLKSLSVEQQIAQCIWIPAWSDREVSHTVEVADVIRKYGIGGIIFFQGTSGKQAELSNFYQSISKVPLLIATDAEWGLGMRLTDVEKFPYQMTLGALQNDSLIYFMGKAVAAQSRRLGVHMNLAPVADINNNPLNPVINYRSFGENTKKVASKAMMYMKGMQDNGLIATAKHFPGHGDTDMDSHYDLPVISHSRERLDSIELYPFTILINNGVSSVMTAHLRVTSLDTSANLPSSLSGSVINGLLIKQLGFKGLVITDAMNMQGVTRYFKTGVADARAFEAGNDVIEYVTDVGTAIKEIQNLLQSKKITKEELALRCRKILALKFWAGLNDFKPVSQENITDELSPGTTKALIRELYASAITVINNNQNIIPVKRLEKLKIATVAINERGLTLYQERISKYVPADHFFIDTLNPENTNALIKKLSVYDIVVAGIFNTDQRSSMNFGIPEGLDSFLEKLCSQNRTIVTYFGNPYAIARLKSVHEADALIITYQENSYTEDLSAQLIFGDRKSVV